MTRSSRLKAMGLVETEPRAASRVFEPLVLLNTPDGLSYIVLGRYNGTVVTWARLINKSRRLATVRMNNGRNYCMGILSTACEVNLKLASQMRVCENAPLDGFVTESEGRKKRINEKVIWLILPVVIRLS